MAHGAGLYWNRQHKAGLQTEEYAVICYRLFDYYYPDMSDSYEPTCEAKDEYKIEVLKWRTDRYGHQVADHISESVTTGSVDKNMANKIYWNLKNRNINFDTVKKFFQDLQK